jgi:putative thioredoxin
MSYELKDFQAQVAERSQHVPVVVDFWAPWCGPCKQLGPVIEDLASKASGRWELVKVNTEDHPKTALDYEVTSIPDVRLFRGGEVIAEFKGFMPPEAIEEWLGKYLPSVREDEIIAARKLAGEGKLTEALERMAAVLNQEPGNEAARLEAAEWALRSDPAKCTELLAPFQDDSDLSDQVKGLQALAEFTADADTALASADGKSKDAFEAGLAALRAGDYDVWIDRWIETIERKKDFADGRLIEACKAAFRFLGARHPAVAPNYRRFTSALY